MEDDYDLPNELLVLPVREEMSAQDLVALDVSYSGFLKHKRSVLGFHRWIRCYAIIYRAALYLYQGAHSKKPYFSASLIAFDKIEKTTSKYNWTFCLKPLVNNIPEMFLLAAARQEMVHWMAELRVSMLVAHGRPSDVVRHQADMIRWNSNFSLSGSEFEESVYSVCDERESAQARLHTLHANSSLYTSEGQHDYLLISNDDEDSPKAIDETEQKGECSKRCSSAESSEFGDCICSVDELNPDEESKSVEVDESKQYYDKAMFYGTRAEARNILIQIKQEGAFLVRVEGQRHVLSVRGKEFIYKYVLSVDQENGKVCIENSDNHFQSIPQLLYFYHSQDLPNQNIVLQFPFLSFPYDG